MNICVLMPTFGRTVELIQNALACYERQTYPADKRFLLACDDEPHWQEQAGDRWTLERMYPRAPDLGAKYNLMMRFAEESGVCGWEPDAYVVWDDDDVYLPHHLTAYAEALADRQWAHPWQVWSTYTGAPSLETASGRFHGALGIRADAGRWVETLRGTFDQEMIEKLQRTHGDPGRPDARRLPSYVFRWADTGSHHCQAYMRGRDEGWYDTYAGVISDRRRDKGERAPEVLAPQLDAAAERAIFGIEQQIARLPRAR